MINIKEGQNIILCLKSLPNKIEGKIVFWNHEEWDFKWGCINILSEDQSYDSFFKMDDIVCFSIKGNEVEKKSEFKLIYDKDRLKDLAALKKERDLLEKESIKDFLTKDKAEVKPVKYEMPSFKKRT